MVKPPCELFGRRIFEIDDDVLPITELILTDMLSGFVCKALVFDFRSRIDMRPEKA